MIKTNPIDESFITGEMEKLFAALAAARGYDPIEAPDLTPEMEKHAMAIEDHLNALFSLARSAEQARR